MVYDAKEKLMEYPVLNEKELTLLHWLYCENKPIAECFIADMETARSLINNLYAHDVRITSAHLEKESFIEKHLGIKNNNVSVGEYAIEISPKGRWKYRSMSDKIPTQISFVSVLRSSARSQEDLHTDIDIEIDID